ncbi:MAG: ribosomal protein L7/L12 [Acidobacteriia bacterium]|nr:ribosomal protein L7/L12 [Terriglobia bacterium]
MPDSSRPFPPTAAAALSNGNKIEAIKIVRQEWGLDLKDAKDAVEAYVKTQPALAATMQEASASSQRGCITWLLVLALAGAAVYYFLRAR